MATKSNIYKFDFDLNYTPIFNQSDYDIYTMCVNNDNEIIFNALRNNDGVVVIGIIDSKGNVDIIDDTFDKKITSLEFL